MSGGAVAERIARLSPEQREALFRRLRGRGAPAAGAADSTDSPEADTDFPVLRPRPAERGEPFPLSDVQQVYWIGRAGVYDLSGCGTNAYFEVQLPPPPPPLDGAAGWTERLAAALGRLVARHEMLRAVVLPDGRQRILPPPPAAEVARTVTVVDLRGAGREEVDGRIERLRDRLRYGAGDLGRWPLFDVVVHLLDEGPRLHLRLETLIFDGDSRNVLFAELFRLLDRPDAELPPLECSYRDVVLTWEAFRRSPRYALSRRFWDERIEGLPPAPELPLAVAPAPADRVRLKARSIALLGQPAWERLKGRAAALGVTPSVAVLGAFAEVLGAWNGAAPFTLALEGSYRPPIHPQIRDIVGNFNTLLLLAAEGGAGSFADRVRRLGDRSRQALDHWVVSGFEVAREVNRRRGRGSRPPVPIVFNSLIEYSHRSYRPPEDVDARLGELAYHDAGIYVPQLLMMVTVAEYGGLFCNWQAAEGVFPPGLSEDLAGAFGRLLAALADGEAAWRRDRRETAAWLVPPAQRTRRARWEGGGREAGGGARATGEGLGAAFGRRAAEAPDRVAVVEGDAAVSYGELARRVAGLADRLRTAGGSGGDAGSGEGDRKAVAGGLATRAATALGLLAGGGGLASAAEAIVELAGLAPGDRVLGLAPAGSGRAVVDLLAPLAAGATAVAAVGETTPAGAAATGTSKASASAELTPEAAAVTVLSATPELAARFAAGLEAVFAAGDRGAAGGDGEGVSAYPALRFALLGGDRVPISLPARLAALAAPSAGFEAVALHGEDEAGVWSLVRRLGVGTGDGSWRPLPGRRATVLSRDLAPCPDWVAGRLHLDRPGAGDDGWLGTAEVARFLPDGGLELFGREGEAEIAALGHPIMPARIAARLEEHPAVDRVAVVASGGAGAPRPPENGGRPAAFVVLRAGARPPAPGDLAAWVAERWPYYAVPARVEVLAELPVAADGRVDRAALSRRAARARTEPPPAASSDAAHRTGRERALAERWRRLLGVERVGRDDDFFDLGGDSLALARLATELRREEGDFPLAAFFACPTVAGLASALEPSPAPQPDLSRR